MVHKLEYNIITNNMEYNKICKIEGNNGCVVQVYFPIPFLFDNTKWYDNITSLLFGGGVRVSTLVIDVNIIMPATNGSEIFKYAAIKKKFCKRLLYRDTFAHAFLLVK